jgi:hypothetical protein
LRLSVLTVVLLRAHIQSWNPLALDRTYHAENPSLIPLARPANVIEVDQEQINTTEPA